MLWGTPLKVLNDVRDVPQPVGVVRSANKWHRFGSRTLWLPAVVAAMLIFVGTTFAAADASAVATSETVSIEVSCDQNAALGDVVRMVAATGAVQVSVVDAASLRADFVVQNGAEVEKVVSRLLSVPGVLTAVVSGESLFQTATSSAATSAPVKDIVGAETRRALRVTVNPVMAALAGLLLCVGAAVLARSVRRKRK